MGEVWQAYDLKLRVEVALKALRVELSQDEHRLELLRSEVRAAREVTSPNVCRIFDLVELDGQELVSMEYVDGTTLLDVLREEARFFALEALWRGPTAFVVNQDPTSSASFSRGGSWLVQSHLSGERLAVISSHVKFGIGQFLEFDPEGRFLVTVADKAVFLFPIEGPVPPNGRVVFEVGRGNGIGHVGVSPTGESIAITDFRLKATIVRNDGEEPRQLPGAEGLAGFLPDGRLVKGGLPFDDKEGQALTLWDVAGARELATLRLSDAEFGPDVSPTSDGRLLTATSKGVAAWDLETGEQEILMDVPVGQFRASRDGRCLLVTDPGGEAGPMQDTLGSPVFFDLDTGSTTKLTTHGSEILSIALDRDGTVAASADHDGVIRVGSISRVRVRSSTPPSGLMEGACPLPRAWGRGGGSAPTLLFACVIPSEAQGAESRDPLMNESDAITTVSEDPEGFLDSPRPAPPAVVRSQRTKTIHFPEVASIEVVA
jgi:WD40 repeat protein